MLKTTMVDGWLTPTIPMFRQEEDHRSEFNLSIYALNLGTRVSYPGPDFLLFLETQQITMDRAVLFSPVNNFTMWSIYNTQTETLITDMEYENEPPTLTAFECMCVRQYRDHLRTYDRVWINRKRVSRDERLWLKSMDWYYGWSGTLEFRETRFELLDGSNFNWYGTKKRRRLNTWSEREANDVVADSDTNFVGCSKEMGRDADAEEDFAMNDGME